MNNNPASITADIYDSIPREAIRILIGFIPLKSEQSPTEVHP